MKALRIAAAAAYVVAMASGEDNLSIPQPTSSRLQFHVPHTLYKEEGYNHREALFGVPPYGGSISQNLYYAGPDEDLCSADVNTHAGSPIRAKDDAGQMLSWPTPFVLIVDRGGCSFVQKVRNAQRSGAAAVIIADSSCLCSAGSDCTSQPGQQCEQVEPIMADDGSGSDITVPSFLMFKEDADIVKAELLANRAVRVEMRWSLPAPDDRVEYELWTTPTDVVSRKFLDQFKEAASALGDRAYFTPQMYIYDGILSGCQGPNGENDCFNLCTNSGRYCSTDPDNDLNVGISGADVVAESLRRMCIWKNYGEDDGVGVPWWDYVKEFVFRCSGDKYFSNKLCIQDAMQRSGVDMGKIDSCMKDSGGLEGDVENTMLDKQLFVQGKTGVVILPAVYVNRVSIRGSTEFPTVFKAICAGYEAGTVPEVCSLCSGCGNQTSCISNGYCGATDPNAGDGVSTAALAISMSALAVLFGIVSFVQHWRHQRQVRDQVKGIIAEYMPLDEDQDQPGTSIEDEAVDGEFT